MYALKKKYKYSERKFYKESKYDIVFYVELMVRGNCK